MKPEVLWKSRKVYQEFPERVFCFHIHQELRNQKGKPYWLHKKQMKEKQARGENIADYRGDDEGAGGRLY